MASTATPTTAVDVHDAVKVMLFGRLTITLGTRLLGFVSRVYDQFSVVV